MQRKPLFSASEAATAAAERAFRSDVFRAVMDRRNDELVELLRRHGAAKALRSGFQANPAATQWASFTDLCVSADNLSGLRAVLEAQIRDLTLRGCSEVVRTQDGVTYTVPFDFPASCVARGDARGLDIAFAFDADHPSFTAIHPDHNGTLHYGALVTALQGAKRDVVEAAVRCCKVFARHAAAAPCTSEDFGDGGLRRLFVMGRYDQLGNADLVLPLLRQYVAARLFDLDAPMENPLHINSHLPPLAAAIACGNVSLSGALIDLGCDVDAARGQYPDVVALAAARVGLHRAPETHAAVVGAMMRRRLRQASVAAAAPAAETGGLAAQVRRLRVL